MAPVAVAAAPPVWLRIPPMSCRPNDRWIASA